MEAMSGRGPIELGGQVVEEHQVAGLKGGSCGKGRGTRREEEAGEWFVLF